MKIIDLLNKIANGEEVPKKIKYEKHIYEYEEGTYDWSYYIQNNGTIKFLLTDVFNSDDNILNILNDEVEIIEDKEDKEKKIPEKLETVDFERNYEYRNDCEISFQEIVIKINEIIDCLDYLKSKGE